MQLTIITHYSRLYIYAILSMMMDYMFINNSLRLIALTFILFQSFFIQALEHTNFKKGENTMSLPNFDNTMANMMDKFHEMAELNKALTSGKAKDNPSFNELSERKLAICNELMKDHLEPYEKKRNDYIQSHPGVRLANDGFYTIRNHVREEEFKTKKSIKDPDYVPELPAVTMQVVPGKTTQQRIMEAQEAMDKEVDMLNKQLGGKVFLKRSDYVERSSKVQNKDRIGKKFTGERSL